MKRLEGVIATTHVDSQGERLAASALNDIVRLLSEAYVPVGIEHDPRIPPQGRVESGHIREREDGELEVVAVMSVFDGDSDLPPLEDGREMVAQVPQHDGTTIAYDWTHRSAEDQAEIAAIAKVFGTKPEYFAKKSADPISVITIVGAFVVGGIATGLLGEIGSDAWKAIKARLSKLTTPAGERKGEQLLVLSASVSDGERHVEIDAILTNPTEADIERFLTGGLEVLDKVVPVYMAVDRDVRRMVFEADGDTIKLMFGVRKDCVPLRASRSVKEILDGSADR